MSRFIEGRENFLWTLGSSPEKDDLIAIYIPGSQQSMLGITCSHLACDAVILPRADWKIFKKYASDDFPRLGKSKPQIKEISVSEIKPSLLKHFTELDSRNTYSYFASMAGNLLRKFTRNHNPILQTTFRGRPIPEEDRKLLRKHLNPQKDQIKHCISYIKIWERVKRDIAIREKYEGNIELYDPSINNLPTEIIDHVKSFL